MSCASASSSSRFTPTAAAFDVASITLATKRPAGRISSISAGVLSSITLILSASILAAPP
jgi:hypothetical protein